MLAVNVPQSAPVAACLRIGSGCAAASPQLSPGLLCWDCLDQLKIVSTSRLLAARFAMSEDEMRLRALRKIRTVLLFYPEDSALGKNLLSSAGTVVEESKLTKIIEDSFAGRAAGTLIKRATDFTKFATWLVARRGRPLAPGEQALYDYVSHLRSSESSPTSADSFIKAYKFMMHLSGAMPNPSVSARVECQRAWHLASALCGKRRNCRLLGSPPWKATSWTPRTSSKWLWEALVGRGLRNRSCS